MSPRLSASLLLSSVFVLAEGGAATAQERHVVFLVDVSGSIGSTFASLVDSVVGHVALEAANGAKAWVVAFRDQPRWYPCERGLVFNQNMRPASAESWLGDVGQDAAPISEASTTRLRDWLLAMEAKGKTNIVDALYLAFAFVRERAKDGDLAIHLYTDCVQTVRQSWVSYPGRPEGFKSLSEVLEVIVDEVRSQLRDGNWKSSSPLPQITHFSLTAADPEGAAAIETARRRLDEFRRPPEPPGGVTAVPDQRKILIQWSPSPSPGVEKFSLERAESGNWRPVKLEGYGWTRDLSPSQGVYSTHDEGVESNRGYRYRVAAWCGDRMSAWRESAECWLTQNPPPAPPQNPKIVAATPMECFRTQSPRIEFTFQDLAAAASPRIVLFREGQKLEEIPLSTEGNNRGSIVLDPARHTATAGSLSFNLAGSTSPGLAILIREPLKIDARFSVLQPQNAVFPLEYDSLQTMVPASIESRPVKFMVEHRYSGGGTFAGATAAVPLALGTEGLAAAGLSQLTVTLKRRQADGLLVDPKITCDLSTASATQEVDLVLCVGNLDHAAMEKLKQGVALSLCPKASAEIIDPTRNLVWESRSIGIRLASRIRPEWILDKTAIDLGRLIVGRPTTSRVRIDYAGAAGGRALTAALDGIAEGILELALSLPEAAPGGQIVLPETAESRASLEMEFTFTALQTTSGPLTGAKLRCTLGKDMTRDVALAGEVPRGHVSVAWTSVDPAAELEFLEWKRAAVSAEIGITDEHDQALARELLLDFPQGTFEKRIQIDGVDGVADEAGRIHVTLPTTRGPKVRVTIDIRVSPEAVRSASAAPRTPFSAAARFQARDLDLVEISAGAEMDLSFQVRSPLLTVTVGKGHSASPAARGTNVRIPLVIQKAHLNTELLKVIGAQPIHLNWKRTTAEALAAIRPPMFRNGRQDTTLGEFLAQQEFWIQFKGNAEADWFLDVPVNTGDIELDSGSVVFAYPKRTLAATVVLASRMSGEAAMWIGFGTAGAVLLGFAGFLLRRARRGSSRSAEAGAPPDPETDLSLSAPLRGGGSAPEEPRVSRNEDLLT